VLGTFVAVGFLADSAGLILAVFPSALVVVLVFGVPVFARQARLAFADFLGSYIVECDFGTAIPENSRFRLANIWRRPFTGLTPDQVRPPLAALDEIMVVHTHIPQVDLAARASGGTAFGLTRIGDVAS
jgi:hypothetical protein